MAVLAGLKCCHCTNPIFSFENARIEAGPVDLGREVWICNRCDGVHHVRQIPMHVKRAPRRAITVLSTHSRGDGITELTFAMSDGDKQILLSVQPYDRRPIKMGVNPNDILLKTWELMDLHTVKVMEDKSESSRAAARSVAEVLALMMPPFFNTADEIVREAVYGRYENRNNPDYETPGLGVKTLAAFDDMPKNEKPVVQKRDAKATGKLIPDAAVASCKQALETKIFTVEQIARNYEMSPAEVKGQLGLV